MLKKAVLLSLLLASPFALLKSVPAQPSGTVAVKVTVKTPQDWISNLSASPNAFSPNDDNYCDTTTISYSLGRASTLTLKIFDSNNALVRTLKNQVPDPAGNNTALWDGKNDSGQIQNDGAYTYKIDATDSAGNIALQKQGAVGLDNHFFTITEPANNSSVSGTVNLKAVPSAYVTSHHTFWFAFRPKGTTAYTNIGGVTKQPDNSWQCFWNTTAVKNGEYELVFVGYYYDLNNTKRGETTKPPILFTIDNGIIISSVSAAPNAFSPNADNYSDTTTISYFLNKPGSTTVKIFDSNNNLIKTIKNAVSDPAGTNTAVWDGKSELGIVQPEAAYTYSINSTDSNGNPAAPKQGSITIDNHFVALLSPLGGQNLSGTVTVQCKHSANSTPGHYMSFKYRKIGQTTYSNQIYFALQPDGTWKYDWDTKTIANGDYEMVLVGYYFDLNGIERGETSSPPVPFTVTNGILISNLSAAPNAFSPNADNYCDTTTISYFLGKAGSTTVKILDANNNLIKTVKNAVSDSAGNNTAVWDGKNEAGIVQPDAAYTLTIESTDSDGNSAEPKQSSITLDNHFFTITEPADNTMLSGTVNLKALPSPNTINKYTLWFAVRTKGSTGPFKNIGDASKQADGSWQCSWNTNTIKNGEYDLAFAGYYDDLNNTRRGETTLPITCIVNNDIPDIDNLTAVPNPFSPDETGTFIDLTTGEVFQDPGPNRVLDDTTTVSFTATKEAFFTITIYDGNNQFVKTLAQSKLTPDPVTHKIEVQWNGKDSFGAYVKNGTYKIVVNPGNAEKEKFILVTVDKKPFFTKTKVAPNPFYPYEEGPYSGTKIYYTLTDAAYVTIEMFQGETLIKTLFSNRFQEPNEYSDTWDGKDNSGNAIPTGNYTAKLTGVSLTGIVSDPVFLTVSLLSISDIRISKEAIDPRLNETTVISYQILADAILTIDMYDSNDTLVRSLCAQEHHTAGEYSKAWDGKDSSGTILSDGRYYFTIKDSVSGETLTVYDPRGTGGENISKSTSFSATAFNPALNQFCFFDYYVPFPSLLTLKIRYERFSGPAIKVVKYQELSPSGTFQALWDGRDETGEMADLHNFTMVLWAYKLDNNSILIVGGKPELTDLNVSPVRFSPYLNPYNSPDVQNQAVITYRISKNCLMNIGIYDIKGNLVRQLLDDVAVNQGINSAVWDGKDSQGNFAAAGYYRIQLQARSGGDYSNSFILHSEIYY